MSLKKPKKAKGAAQAIARLPEPPPMPDVHPREPWIGGARDLSSWDRCRPNLMTIRQMLCDAVYHLPPWQRGQVWTPDQQVAFCRTVWDGLPYAPMLLWERRTGPDRKGQSIVVLDGQQRLSAMGATILRADGTPNTPTAAHLDLETGNWQVGPADGHPPITMRRAVDALWGMRYWQETRDEDRWRTVMLCAQAETRLRRAESSVYVIGSGVRVSEAVRIFQAWNVPGVPISPDEIERLIRDIDAEWEPPATDSAEV